MTGEVESEALDASAGDLPTGTVTFLFSDIEESTRLVGELSIPAYRELIKQHHRLLREAFQQRGGYERGTQGDGFLVVFGDAIAALEAAVAVQRSLDVATWPEGVEVRVRIGLHSGRGSLGGDDYIGLDINRAARIAAAAHGGQILISNATRALVDEALPSGVSARFVGEYELKGLDTPERLHQLDIEGLRSDFPLPRAPSPTLERLPSRLTTFVGRGGDIDALRGLLESSRLVTLTGPGGSGKTSLAIELAREMVHDFSDGTWFVDLSTLTDPDLVIPTVARSLGLVEQHERSIDTVLIEHLASRDLLLVLDNFEQVAPAAGIVPSLLESSPGLRVLVTSRSILGVYGEQSYPLQPLGLPDDDVAGDLSILERSDAVTLFVDRATAARPGFSVTSENASAIAEICIRLDGLPLAIELVATRVRHLTTQEILDRIETHRHVLATSGDDRPARQRTLESTIAWSYELLPPIEQDLFKGLSIFTGGFLLEAAEAICNPEHELGMDTLDGLISLTDQSLVHRVAVEGTSRFWMLETIREYGRHLLWESDRRDELIGGHLVYYCELAEQAEQHLMGQDQEEWLDRIEVEHANLRSALGRAIDANRAEEGLRISAALWRFWMQRGYLREGRGWLEKTLAIESDSALVTRARAYTALGGLAFWLFDPDATEHAYESAMAIYRQLGDQEAEAAAMYNLAFVPAMTNQLAETARRFEASLTAATEVPSPYLVARNQIMQGLAAVANGDARTAITHFEEALSFFSQTDDRFHTAWATRSLGRAHFALGELDDARWNYLRGLGLYRDVRNLPGIGQSLSEISALESALGRHSEAMRLAAAVVALREATGAAPPLPAVDTIPSPTELERSARRVIGDEAVDTALVEGRHMSVHEAVAFAERLSEG